MQLKFSTPYFALFHFLISCVFSNVELIKRIGREKIINEKLSHNQAYLEEHSLPEPYEKITQFQFNEECIPSTRAEELRLSPCSFVAAECSMENDEHDLVRKFFTEDDTVVEFGARYGTTTCSIAAVQKNSGKLISVEPDSGTWNIMTENAVKHKCNFYLVRGAISDKPMIVVPHMYGTRTATVDFVQHHTTVEKRLDPAHEQRNFTRAVAGHYTLAQVEKATKLKATAILIDCEGCIESIFQGNDESLQEMLAGVRIILLEGDMAVGNSECHFQCVDYSIWVRKFEKAGFKVAHVMNDSHQHYKLHYVFERV